MLTEEELNFLSFWETHRLAYSKFSSKILRGLPMASIFGFSIIVLLLVVYLFIPDWYSKVAIRNNGTVTAILIAVILLVSFFSYFRMHFQWEMNEQAFKELKAKQHKIDAAK